MKVGDVIENFRHGVKGTDIPVGAVVKYEFGIDRARVNLTVVDVPGIGKMLCFGDEPILSQAPGCKPMNCLHGQNSAMQIVRLPVV